MSEQELRPYVLRPYELRFKKGRKEFTWTFYARSDEAAREYAERKLQEEYYGAAKIIDLARFYSERRGERIMHLTPSEFAKIEAARFDQYVDAGQWAAQADAEPCFRCKGTGSVPEYGAEDGMVECPDCGGAGINGSPYPEEA